jgi:tetratricopeptide (TPR) repeat protein
MIRLSREVPVNGPTRLALAAIVAALFAAAVPTVANADSATATEYFGLVREGREGDPAAAAGKLQAFAESHAADPLADDAWLEVARLREEKLGDFEGAVAAYRRVVETYPDSKGARRARLRIEKLEADRAGGDEPLRRYRAVLGDFAKVGAETSLTRMRDLVREVPDFPQRDAALAWIADQAFRLRHYDQAIADFRRVVTEYPGSKVAYGAARSLGDLYIEKRDFREARRWYASMADYAGVYGFARSASVAALEQLERFESLRRAYWASLAVFVVGLVWLTAGSLRREAWAPFSWRAYAEVPVYLVLAAVPCALLWIKSPRYGGTATGLALGTTVLLVLNRAFLTGRSVGPAARAFHIFVMLLLIAAWIYAVFYAGDLVNIAWDSIRADFAGQGD